MTHLHRGPGAVLLIGIEGARVVARGWGRGGKGVSVHRYRVSIREDEKVLEVDGDDGCPTM